MFLSVSACLCLCLCLCLCVSLSLSLPHDPIRGTEARPHSPYCPTADTAVSAKEIPGTIDTNRYPPKERDESESICHRSLCFVLCLRLYLCICLCLCLCLCLRLCI